MYFRGIYKEKFEEYKGALADFNRAIKLKTKFKEVFFARGLTKSFLEDDEGAIADFNKAININPKNLDAYLYRGYAKLMISDLKGACDDWLFLKSSGNLDAKTEIEEYCS